MLYNCLYCACVFWKLADRFAEQEMFADQGSTPIFQHGKQSTPKKEAKAKEKISQKNRENVKRSKKWKSMTLRTSKVDHY